MTNEEANAVKSRFKWTAVAPVILVITLQTIGGSIWLGRQTEQQTQMALQISAVQSEMRLNFQESAQENVRIWNRINEAEDDIVKVAQSMATTAVQITAMQDDVREMRDEQRQNTALLVELLQRIPSKANAEAPNR